MKTSFILASSTLLAASRVSANPLFGRAEEATNSTSPSLNATEALQFALTLEHLESTFYQEALAKYDPTAFEEAGYSTWVRGRFEQIGNHEQTHTAFLTEALGNDSVAACNYSFPYDSPQTFVALSFMLESVGVSAYIGAAKYLVNDTAALAAAAEILAVEARHSSWIKSSVNESYPWSSPYDTPLTPTAVYSLASQFITECPESNAKLPLTAFPGLNITSSNDTIAPGDQVDLVYNTTSNATEYLAFYSGRNTTIVEITNKTSIIPSYLLGFVYAVVTSSNSSITDENTVAGPVILSFPISPYVSNY